MSAATKKQWQLFLSLGYVALFLYLFLVRPAPEQSLRSAIQVAAEPNQVAALVQNGRTGPLRPAFCPSLKTLVARWIAGESFSPSSLLTRSQQMRFWVEPRGDAALLWVELSWQVRAGLLGKALDAVLARDSHQDLLAESLRRLKATADERRAALAKVERRPPCKALSAGAMLN